MQIILGSSSPRRQELLRQAGYDFTIRKPDTPEEVRKGEGARRMVARLAREKAEAILAQRPADAVDFVIISADTTVVAPSGRILNKPTDAEDALRILRQIQGRRHTVLTGYCLLGRRGGKLRRHERVVKTQVEIRRLDRASMEAYIATGEPMDKAGAYAAQGIGMTFIAGIRGSYTNVVGLPMSELVEDLERKFGWGPAWKSS